MAKPQDKPQPRPPLPPLPEGAKLSEAERRKWFGYFFFAAFALLIWQLLRILAVFADPLIWAATLALIFFPLHQALKRRLPPNDALAAAATTVCVLLLVLVPLILIGWVMVAQSAEVYPVVRDLVIRLKDLQDRSAEAVLPAWALVYWDRGLGLADQWGVLDRFEALDLQELALKNLNAASSRLADWGAFAARNAAAGLFNLALVVAGLFFCFKDGEAFVHRLIDLLPMPPQHSRAVGARVYGTLTAIVNAALITAAVQGGVAGLGYLIAGVPLAVFFGVLTGIAAMIPVVGAALLWLPLGLYMLSQSVSWGLFVLGWGLMVSTLDNLLKPILIGAGTKMHILLMFFAVLGGVQVYGVTGLVLGPVLTACALAFLTIYREEYAAKRRS